MTTVHFRPVRLRIEKTGQCPRCSKRTKRARTFEQTVNPWNLVADRSRPKTVPEIYAELRRQAADWGPDFRHEACKP